MAYKESIIVLPSFTSPTTADLAELHKLTDRERAWNQGMPSYPDEQTIMRAYRYTELVKVREDTNMRPVTRFIKPELHSVFPPFLLPIAQQVRREVGALWRARASELGVDPAIRLAITSMVRSQRYNDELVANGKPAVSDSSHTLALAFDIDRSGYYQKLPDGSDASVTLRPDSYRQIIGQELQQRLGTTALQPVVNSGLEFDRRVPQALNEAVIELHEAGSINAVPEFSGGENACLHIGVNPRY